MLLDLTGTGVTGKALRGAARSGQHYGQQEHHSKETLSPFVTSGVRIRYAAVTTRGMKEAK